MPIRKLLMRYGEKRKLGQQLRVELRARRDKSKDPSRRNVYNAFIWSQAAKDLNSALVRHYRRGMISKPEVSGLALKFIDHLAGLPEPGHRVAHSLKSENGHELEMVIETGRVKVRLIPAGKKKA